VTKNVSKNKISQNDFIAEKVQGVASGDARTRGQRMG
jgi:hypothetical protein